MKIGPNKVPRGSPGLVSLLSPRSLATISGSHGLQCADIADGEGWEHGMVEMRVPGRKVGV